MAAASDAGASVEFEKARRASLDQIDGGFAKMTEASAAKLHVGVQTDDRSGPMVEPGTVSKHEFAAARRKSLDQIANNFSQMDAKSAARFSTEATKTDDRSDPIIEEGLQTTNEFAKARRASLDQIQGGFANMDARSASKFQEGVEAGSSADNKMHKARRSSLDQIQAMASEKTDG